jgi:hypothetical protein
VINETIDGESIMINLATGNYYSLDTIGGEVWELLEQSFSVEQIATALGRRYEASEEAIRSAVEDLLQELSSEELVVRDDSPGVAPSALPPSLAEDRVPFSTPKLQKFTDMQDLILLDPVHEVDSRGWPYAANDRVGG